MPGQKISDIYAQWAKGSFRPVYVLAGEEAFLAEGALRKLGEALKVDALNREMFYGAETTASELANAVQTMPFIAERRLVIVKEANKIRAAEASKIAEIIANPPESSCLAIVWPEKVKKESLKSPILAAAEKAGAVVEFKTFYERDMLEWVRSEAAAGRKVISSDAANYLIQECGSSLMDLHNELEKLLLFVGPKKEIELADVETLSGHTRQANLFELAETIESKDIKRSLEVLKSLLEESEPPVLILTVAHRAVRRLLTAKSMLEEMGLSREEASRKLALHRFFDRDFFRKLDKFTLKELEAGIKLVLEADIELKTSSRPENAVLENLFLGLSGNKL